VFVTLLLVVEYQPYRRGHRQVAPEVPHFGDAQVLDQSNVISGVAADFPLAQFSPPRAVCNTRE